MFAFMVRMWPLNAVFGFDVLGRAHGRAWLHVFTLHLCGLTCSLTRLGGSTFGHLLRALMHLFCGRMDRHCLLVHDRGRVRNRHCPYRRRIGKMLAHA